MFSFRKKLSIFLVFLGLNFISAYAQEKNELNPSDTDLIILFTVSIAIVIGIFLYLARETILRKKTSYDERKFASQKNRDFEKYHSDWTDDYIDFGTRSKMSDKEFQEQLEDSKLPDCYKVLGIKKSATIKEIKEKYRRLAKEFHPDKTKTLGSAKKMAEINQSYEILSDEDKRERYDKFHDVS